jgi:hypothetical protein
MFFLWTSKSNGAKADTPALGRCLSGLDPDSFSGPWASTKDRSPVRRFYTNGVAEILFEIALRYSEELIKANRLTEAESTLQWLENFERKTEIGSVSTEKIARMRSQMQRR